MINERKSFSLNRKSKSLSNLNLTSNTTDNTFNKDNLSSDEEATQIRNPLVDFMRKLVSTNKNR